ncbi:hypothetical protein [Mangrovibacterium diazotrophicum]|uniref:Uncharacterized protein n=1 Tax=Mangrovibacterium diazotrophicum TaxID=1261403 RepID=A0A419W3I8_9BACT|nr:hypothetical protein [Mangrovibacterium diazotrophicum]RKD90038.1 hypothetical protein BC643_0374 [Mangrovibacterium diazotrophicum]
MINIFSEVSAIEEIFDSGEYPNWKKIIGTQANIYLNIDQATLDRELEGDDNEESFLFLLYHENDAIKRPSAFGDQFQFADNTATMVDHPFGIFILDIDEDKANELGSQYGIQIYSSRKLSDIQDFEIDFDFEKDELIQCKDGVLKGYGFVLNSFKSERSNSTVIVDRNLFSNEERTENVGVANMVRYFDCILPDVLLASFDILFVLESSRKFENETFRLRIVKNITDSIQKLRGYSINVEILLVHRSTVIFEHTHQRRILKNYHFGNSEHGFAIFSVSNQKKIRNDNDFNLQAQYHSLLNTMPRITSDKKHSKLIKRLTEIRIEAERQLDKQGQNDRYYRLYLNGTESALIVNRLLN